MRISKRTMSMILALVLALSVTAFGTVAYLTDRTSVTNTFTIGDVDIEMDETDVDEDGNPIVPGGENPDLDGDGKPEVDLDGDGTPDIEVEVTPDGDIIIDPTPDNPSDPENDIVVDPNNPEVDLNGDEIPDIKVEVGDDEIIITPIDPETGDPSGDPIVIDPTPEEPGRTDENEYKMVPGKSYIKDPTITVKQGSEECYVRMRVRINMLNALKAIIDKYPDIYVDIDDEDAMLQQFMPAIDSANWQYIDWAYVTDDLGQAWLEYEFWHKKADADDSVKVNADAADVVLPTLFDEVSVPVWFDNDDLKSINGFTMDVFGDAIQTVSFDNDVEAWEAFDNQHGFGGGYE